MTGIKKIKPIVEPKKTDKDLAEEIVTMVSSIINQRNGIGEVWRLLNNGRKKEIKAKWEYEIQEILKAR